MSTLPLFDDSVPDLTTGESGAPRMTKQRAQHVNLRDADGVELGTAGNPIVTSGGGAGTSDVNLIEVGGSAIGLGQNNMAGSVPVALASDQPALPISATDLDIRNLTFATDKVDASGSTGVGVTGAFFQATQPVSAASLPLPAGAATEATLAAIDAGIPAALGQTTMAASMPVAIASNQSPLPVDGSGVTQPVSALNLDIRDLAFATDKADVSGSSGVGVTGSFFQATQPVSAAALPLPAGAATSALQLPDGHNVTVNNASGGAAVNIQDGGNIITVDGSVTANAGTNLNTSLLALESGGNLASLAAEDFATQATLALIKAKTDNLDVTLSGGGTHVIVDSAPASSTSALVVDEDEAYTVGDTEALTQTTEGALIVSVAVVQDAASSYLAGQSPPLSLTSDGRLRVVTESESNNFTPWSDPEVWGAHPLKLELRSAWG